MKKGTQILLSITLCFVFLVTGIFIGRQMTKSGITIDTEIPRVAETVSTSLSDGKININTANIDELTLLPNIGNTLAGRIIDYRNEHGLFKSIDDLTRVEGIGNKRVKEIAPYITVGG